MHPASPFYVAPSGARLIIHYNNDRYNEEIYHLFLRFAQIISPEANKLSGSIKTTSMPHNKD